MFAGCGSPGWLWFELLCFLIAWSVQSHCPLVSLTCVGFFTGCWWRALKELDVLQHGLCSSTWGPRVCGIYGGTPLGLKKKCWTIQVFHLHSLWSVETRVLSCVWSVPWVSLVRHLLVHVASLLMDPFQSGCFYGPWLCQNILLLNTSVELISNMWYFRISLDSL